MEDQQFVLPVPPQEPVEQEPVPQQPALRRSTRQRRPPAKHQD
jgi:hypothetical protein